MRAILLTLAVSGCTAPEPAVPIDSGEAAAVDTADSSGPSPGDSAETEDATFATPSHPYLLALHTCPIKEEVCGNPMNHTVRLAGSEDGGSWTVLESVEPFSGSVPDVIVRDGILYIYSLPELRRIDLSDGSVLPRSELTFLTDEALDTGELGVLHADPSMILDADGRLVMFFLEGSKEADPASCPEIPCTRRILSATEEPGSQGTVFTVDDGARLEILIEEEGPSRLSDPDIFVGPDGYVLMVSRGQSIRVYISDTLRGTYTPLGKDNLTPGTGGVPAGAYIDGQYWLYASVDEGGVTSDIQWAALDGIDTILPADALSPITIDGIEADTMMASPGFWAEEP